MVYLTILASNNNNNKSVKIVFFFPQLNIYTQYLNFFSHMLCCECHM